MKDGTGNVPLRLYFIEIWRRNAAAARVSRDSGVLQSFEDMGQQTVFVIVEFPDNDALDETLSALPIFEQLGSAVEIEVTPVRPHDGFAEAGSYMEGVDQEADVDGQLGLTGAPQMNGGCSAV